jgi:hypothetical protein
MTAEAIAKNAVDVFQEYAQRHGLVAKHGQDVVQAIMPEAFQRVRAGEMPP